MNDIKNCPFCGDRAILLSERSGFIWQVQCGRCGASGRNGTKEEATIYWNTRTADTELTRCKEALEFLFETAGLGAELYPIEKMDPVDYDGLSDIAYQFKNATAKTALEAVEAVMKQERARELKENEE